MVTWVLVIMFWAGSNNASSVTIPMQDVSACKYAMAQDYPGLGDKAFCINTVTGEVKF